MSRLPTLLRILPFLLVPSVLVIEAVVDAPEAFAGITTGTIKGQTVDEGGLTIPGVQLTVNSASLIGGAQQYTSDENGRFIFANLPPGTSQCFPPNLDVILQRRPVKLENKSKGMSWFINEHII